MTLQSMVRISDTLLATVREHSEWISVKMGILRHSHSKLNQDKFQFMTGVYNGQRFQWKIKLFFKNLGVTNTYNVRNHVLDFYRGRGLAIKFREKSACKDLEILGKSRKNRLASRARPRQHPATINFLRVLVFLKILENPSKILKIF